jgi:hypothetical protein
MRRSLCAQKCDYDTDLFSDNEVECELDAGIFSTAIEFDCPVNTRTCSIECNWVDVRNQVPGATW